MLSLSEFGAGKFFPVVVWNIQKFKHFFSSNGKRPWTLSKEIVPRICSPFEIFWNFRFNEKRHETRAYSHESIDHRVLFALLQLSVGYFCLFKNKLCCSFIKVLKFGLKNSPIKNSDAYVYFYNTALKMLRLISIHIPWKC